MIALARDPTSAATDTPVASRVGSPALWIATLWIDAP